MNKVIKDAKKIMSNEYVQEIPELEIGDEVRLGDVWDGEGSAPENSYSYKIANEQWINYEFKIVEKNDDPLETIVKITNIELI